jgi:hypothetical protein
MDNYLQGLAPTIKAPRSHFDMSNRHATTIDFDYIYPVYHEEVLSGDTFSMNATIFGRILTLIHPIIENVWLDIHFFYAPTRILWTNAKKFYGEQVDPGDSIDYTVPVMAAPATTGYAELSLSDYLELPTKVPDYEHISLYHRCYNFVWNEYYRDQSLQDSITVDLGDGPDTASNYVLKKRNKAHDYITTGLPNLLKDPATSQTLPLGSTADIKFHDNFNTGGTGADDDYLVLFNDSGTFKTHYGTARDTDTSGIPAGGKYNTYADLTNATAATIMQLRQAVQIQAILELDARSGTRYHEQIYAVYGVTLSNVEAYRPLYLGGGSIPINIDQIPQTSNDGTNGNVGDLGANGLFAGGAGFSKSFEEPGVILGLVSARSELTYQQGLDRKMSRTDRYSYFHPLLQGIGDQATLKKEVVCQSPTTDTGSTGTADNERTFNYNERYAEYKYRKNAVTGLFRSNCTSSLESWHLAEEFSAAEPNYNSTFIEQNTPMDRAVQTPAEPHLLLDCHFNCQAARPMHMYSIPGFGSRL